MKHVELSIQLFQNRRLLDERRPNIFKMLKPRAVAFKTTDRSLGFFFICCSVDRHLEIINHDTAGVASQ